MNVNVNVIGIVVDPRRRVPETVIAMLEKNVAEVKAEAEVVVGVAIGIEREETGVVKGTEAGIDEEIEAGIVIVDETNLNCKIVIK